MLQKPAVFSFPREFKDIDKSSTGVLIERQFGCPFDKTVFSAPGLKSKALQTEIDDFYLTRYTGAIGDRTYIDYSLFDIKICPACLYANRYSGFRIYDSINKSWCDPREFTIKEKYVEAMKESVDRRFRIAAQAGLGGHRLFSAKRTLEDAIIAASLAIDSVTTLSTVAQANEKAGLLYLKGVFHIQMSQCYHKIELLSPKDGVQLHQDFRLACLCVAMDAFKQLEDGFMQDKYFQGLHQVMLYYYQKMVVAELIGDKNTFDASKQAIRKYYGDYCFGMGKGTPEEKKAAKLFFDAIDEGTRKYDSKRSLCSGRHAAPVFNILVDNLKAGMTLKREKDSETSDTVRSVTPIVNEVKILAENQSALANRAATENEISKEDRNKIKIMRATDFFSPFTDQELPVILRTSTWLRCGRGDIILREGESSEPSFFVVLKGSISIQKRLGGTNMKKTMFSLKRGDCFGEMSVITGQPRSADVVAEEETYVLKINADTLKKETDSFDMRSIQFKFYKAFCQILAQRLAITNTMAVKL